MRRVIIFIFVVPIIIVAVFILSVFVKSYIYQEKLYYVEELNLYIKTFFRLKDPHAFVLFSRDSDLILSDSLDYIKTTRNIGSFLLINPQISDTIFIKSNLRPPSKMHSTNFSIIYGIEENDSTFFKKRDRTRPIIIKKPYIGIIISPHFEHLYIKKSNSSSLKRINPIDYYYKDGATITLFKGALQRIPLLSSEAGYFIQKQDTTQNRIINIGEKDNKAWREDAIEGIRIYYNGVSFENKHLFDAVLDSLFVYQYKK